MLEKSILRMVVYGIFCAFTVGGLAQQKVVRVGVVVDGPWERNAEIQAMTEREILTLTEGEFDVRFPAAKRIVCDWTMAGAHAAVDRLLNDPDVDILLTMGVLASHAACRQPELPKPVIAPFVIDAALQGLPEKDGASGVKNLNYLSLPARVLSDVKIFREIVPFRKLTFLINKEIWNTIPQLTPRLHAVLQGMGVEGAVVPVEGSMDSALRALTAETEAVYLAPLLNVSSADFDRLVQELIAKRIPSFSMMGVKDVERGILASASPDIFPKVARRIALNLQRILLGEEPGSIPTAFAIGEQLTINMHTARAIRVSPPFSVMTEAILIQEERRELQRRVSLSSVIQEAVDKNLDLASREEIVAAGQRDIRIAGAQLLPQVDIAATGLLIDSDRAEASFGTQAERTLTGKATATQLLFAEKALANVSIQRKLHKSRLAQLQQLRLDIAQQAATAYLNVLRAKTFETVQKENLKRTRSNLELAKVREAIGYSGRSEVFRWESEIATARKNVIRAIAQRNLAEIAMNRILHHPLEEPFATLEAKINDPALGISRKGLLDYFDDLFSFKTFRAFMVREGLSKSPELQALDKAIAAKAREQRSVTRSFYLPSVALQGEVSRFFKEGGAGTSSPFAAGLPGLPGLPGGFTLPSPDNTNWSLALNFSLPLFTGGSRLARRSQTSLELENLKLARQALSEKIEQRIRSALHVASASRAGIRLSQDAATAAKQNLDLVRDAYSKGVLDILDLLDAQNAALNADLAAASAVYDFIIDVMEVERSTASFYYFASSEERDSWFQRLKDFFARENAAPDGP